MKIEIPFIVMLSLSIVSVENRKSQRRQRKKSSTIKTVDDVIESVCLPRRTDRLVYRFKNDTHIYIGFDNLKECTVYSMTWKIHEGNPDHLRQRRHRDYDLEPSSEVRKYPNHYIFAAAAEGQQKMLREFMEDCNSSITPLSCLMEVFAKTAQKMKKVDFSGKCDTRWPTHCDQMKV